jgi:transposase
LHHLKLSFKKSLRAAEQDRPDVAAARSALQRRQKKLDPRRLVFLDETAVSTTITRLYGRAPQGEPLIQKVLHGNWKTVTFIAALRHDRVTAPFVLEGAMNGETFKAYVEQFLAPTLKKGDIVCMDNASVHMVEGVEEAIEARGRSYSTFRHTARTSIRSSNCLPSSSPCFARLPHILSSKRRTPSIVYAKAIASSLTEITRSECAAYLANSGYVQSYRETLYCFAVPL